MNTTSVTVPRYLGSAGAIREILHELGIFREGIDPADFIKILDWRIEGENIKMTATTDTDVKTEYRILNWRVKRKK